MRNQGGLKTRTLFASPTLCLLAGLSLLPGVAALALGSEADSLTLTGKIVLADGSPAAGAIIERLGTNKVNRFESHADADGRFQIAARFENGVQLQVRTADGGQQAIHQLSAPAVRAAVRTPQEIKLRPAATQKVVVTAAGNPVAKAEVIVTGSGFVASATTDSAGQAEVRFPMRDSIKSIAAFHPALGVNGEYFRETSIPKEIYKIELLPPSPHEIHVIDDDGRPVANVEFGVSMGVGDRQVIVLSSLTAAHRRTDEAGIARMAWMPGKLNYVSPEIWNDEWKVDELNRDRIKEGITTQKLRRKLPVSGRLVVPPGIDPSGILISADGFGTAHTGDLSAARSAPDGTFTLMVPANHSYAIGILDNEWASDPWTGDLRTDYDPKQVQVEFKLYPATPLTVRITRGPERKPVANMFVQLDTEREFKFTGDDGKRGDAQGGVRCWLLTDAEGVARVGVGRGEHKLSLYSDNWTEERTVNAKSVEPVEVDFHRPWIGNRKITGELVDAGLAFTPSPAATFMAWSTPSIGVPRQLVPRLLDQGKFEVEFDAEQASLLFHDPAQKRSGMLEIGPQDTTVTLKLQPTASYGGTLLDEAGQPVADQEIYLAPGENFASAIVSQQADAAGKFHWDSVPVQTALTVRIRGDLYRPTHYISRAQRQFEPGETRENEKLVISPLNDKAPAPAKIPLAEGLAVICRDARLNATRALVVLEGDESESTRSLLGRLLDTEETPDVLAYRLMSMSPVQQTDEAAAIAARKWPLPKAGELVFVVLDSAEATVAHIRLKAANLDSALAEGRQFLGVHRPAQRDAQALLVAAREEAKTSGRRMWVVNGGPRCGPCFRLARWMDEQHAILEKDYVLVKAMEGLDKNAETVSSLLPGADSNGIPYYAIMEPDGKVLITSKGPFGNIGMPSEVEGIRHLKQMLEQTAQRLSPAEIDALEKSLAPK